MVGNYLENYKIVAILGEGGMGIVYKALDLKLERYVAIKILSPQATANPQFVERFKREAKNQAKLTHPNIVPVYGFAEERQTLGIVMEYVDGETLEHLIHRKGKMELIEALDILKQILAGADYAHSKGFVHRDIKPSNIIISSDGTAKIMDFGISKSIYDSKGITKTGTKLGTILYMSPEQIKALEPTGQSDIYSIGITFYEMLSGKTPFDVGTEFKIMEAHLKKNPPKLSDKTIGLPSEVDRIISKALNKSTAKRYATGAEFLADVNKFYDEITSPAVQKRITKQQKLQNKQPLKDRIRFYAFALFFLCLFAGLFYFVYTTVEQFWNNPAANSSITFNQPDSKASSLYKWENLKSPTTNSLNSICFINDSLGFACGNQGTVIKTVNGGSKWYILSDSSAINLYDIKFISAHKGFIVGEKGTILSTSDEGTTWEKLNADTNATLFKIYFLKNKSTGFIIGALGTILKTNDSGNTWVPVTSPTEEFLYGISFADDNNGFIVGWNGTILKTTDGGNTWAKEKSLNNKYIRDITFLNKDVGILVGGGGEIARTDNGGRSWGIIPSHLISGLYGVFFPDNDHGIIISSKGEILVSTNEGKKWVLNKSSSYSSLMGIAETPSKKIFIVTNSGAILTN